MRNLARAGFAVLAIAVIVGTANVTSTVEARKSSAIDSQNNIQIDYSNPNIEKYEVDVDLETEEAAPAAHRGNGRYKATAYCLRGKTASGRYVRRGIVAADPRVLRLGTRIHMTGGRYTGNYLVADTGGKIKGRILDIWVPSCAEARRWGRRSVTVKVLGRTKKRR